MTRNRRNFFTILAFLTSISVAFAQDGDQAAPAEQPAGRSAQLTLDDLRTFTDVFNQARKNYVEEVDDKTLLDAAIRGMLRELDPHSNYLPVKEYEDLNDAARGRYSGIGIDVRGDNGKIVVNAIINDSPADQAGMNPGDMIISIDGRPVKGRLLGESMDELQGQPDTEVVLIVVPQSGEERELTITRRYIKLPTLTFRLLDDSFGYFKVAQFHRDSAMTPGGMSWRRP